MSNASLKEQLQAVASQFGDGKSKKELSGNSHKPARKKVMSKQDNKSSKPKWLDHAQYGVELLKAYFPECFKLASEMKPLKKGIKQDLVKRLSTIGDIVIEDKACMVKSLSYYVNTSAYYKSVFPGNARIDLDGKEVGVVTQEESDYSKDRQKAKLNAKKGGKPVAPASPNKDAVTQ